MVRAPHLPVKAPLVWPPQLGPRAEKRYREIICCLAKGLKLTEIASATGLTRGAVKNYCSKMRTHFGAATNIEVVLIARREWNLDL